MRGTANQMAFFHRRLLLTSVLCAVVVYANTATIRAYITDSAIYSPPSYPTMQPPAPGGSYMDPVFGTGIKRLTNAMSVNRADTTGLVTSIAPEYSSMSPFNQDNTRLLLVHFSY